MNNDVVREFNEYLRLTGDVAGAACLTLTAALRECTSGPPAPLPPPSPPPAAAPQASHSAPPNQPLTVPEVAKFLRVHRDKVLSWIRSGRLRGFNVAEKENGRPKYRVKPDDLEAFINTRMPFQPIPKGRPPGRRRRFPDLPSELPSL
jgi:excisionase family DNA binding protein